MKTFDAVAQVPIHLHTETISERHAEAVDAIIELAKDREKLASLLYLTLDGELVGDEDLEEDGSDTEEVSE